MITTKVEKQVALLLKRRPTLYHLVARIYFTLQPIQLMELVFGTRVREREWARRHLHKGNDWNNRQHLGEADEWVMSYWDSRDHPHRQFLMERISNFSPISTILELGCNCGPNLYLLAKKFPDAEIRGIDINPRAVEKGNELFASQRISNVKLSVGEASELGGQFQDKSFDIVFTNATLIYIGPDKIEQVISEMIGVARKALILMEWHSFQSKGSPKDGLGVYYLGCWKRDYTTLLKQFVREEQIQIVKIPQDIWPAKGWKDFGAIIEVVLEQTIASEISNVQVEYVIKSIRSFDNKSRHNCEG